MDDVFGVVVWMMAQSTQARVMLIYMAQRYGNTNLEELPTKIGAILYVEDVVGRSAYQSFCQQVTIALDCSAY